MKFQNLKGDNIFAPGYFVDLLEEVESGKAVTKIANRLNEDELARIPTIYAKLDPSTSIMDLDSSATYITHNDKEILGSDIKAITFLMYSKPRSAYCKFKGSQVHSQAVNGAVPLPLLAFKRYRNIEYDRWREQMHQYVKVITKREGTKTTYEFKMADEAVEKIFKVDLLLGSTYASTYYDANDDTIKLKSKYGLILLAAFANTGLRPEIGDVRYMREAGMGRYPGHFSTAFGAVRIDSVPKERKVNPTIINTLYNKCDTSMKLLLAERWAWYGMHRTDDMICDPFNWSRMPENKDTPGSAFAGLPPSTENKTSMQNIKERFGI